MLRLFPRYDRDDLMMRLFYKAIDHQWSAQDVDWDAPVGLTPRQAVALTNIITPVYLGEQAAMNGAATVLPAIIAAGETAAQLYLSTFLLDEGRHFDALTRLYDHLGNRPVALRRMPEMLRYHQRLSKGDRIDWLWGILISDLFAREFYLTFSTVQPGALFGRLSKQILQDESRHQAFAHTYLKHAVPQLSAERRAALVDMKDELLETMTRMNRRLQEDADVLGIDGDAFIRDLADNIEAHAAAIGIGGRAAGPGGPGGGGPAWPSMLQRMRHRALEESGGVQWPVSAAGDEPVQAARALEEGLGRRLVARDTPALTAGDLELLVGPRPASRPEARRRGIFVIPAPWRAAAECAACALVALCRRAVLGAAAGARG
jgi:hypothetical protein